MIIKKFVGKTEAQARALAEAELGTNTVVMNVKAIKPEGFFRFLKKTLYEVTAAVEETADSAQKKTFPAVEEPKQANIQSQINIAASHTVQTAPEQNKVVKDETVLEERIENLQHFLEEQFKQEEKSTESSVDEKISEQADDLSLTRNLPIVKKIYETLLDNEVDEKYVNQIMEEVEHVISPTSGLDSILANVYQKLILKFGQPKGIDLSGKKPKIIFFVGPTGVGKTTTIAKIASNYKVDEGRKIALITADTYRIAAADQLRVYANILNVPMTIIYSAEELNHVVDELSDCELILIDTAGFSHRNEQQREGMKEMLSSLDEQYEKEVYLVVSATTKYKDLLEIVDAYSSLTEYRLIFTKLDETIAYGNLLNIRLHTNADMSYATDGQNVPDDIEVFNTQLVVKQLLGGK